MAVGGLVAGLRGGFDERLAGLDHGEGLASEREVRAVLKGRMIRLEHLDPNARDGLDKHVVAGELAGWRVVVVINRDRSGGGRIGQDRHGSACLKRAQERLSPELGLTTREDIAAAA